MSGKSRLISNVANRLSVANRAELKSKIGTRAGEVIYQRDTDQLFTWREGTGLDNGGTDINVGTGSWYMEITDGVHVKWFGAVGDGIVDDYEALQLCLNWGGLIRFGRGLVYKTTTQLKFYDNLELDLNYSTILRSFHTSDLGVGLIGIIEGSENISIFNGVLDANGTNFGNESCNILSGVTISNLKVENVKFLDVVDYHAIDLADSKNIYIGDCEFYGQLNPSALTDKEAIQLDPAYDLPSGYGVIENFVVKRCVFGANTVTGTRAYSVGVGNHSANVDGVVTRAVTVSECIFNECSYCGVHVYAWEDTHITNNFFYNCDKDIYVWRGSGTNPIGTESLSIVGNTFNSSVVNGTSIYLYNNTVSIATIHGVNILNNTFNIIGTVIRAFEVESMKISGNSCNGITGLANMTNCEDIMIYDNYVDHCTGTGVFVALSSRNIDIKGNTFKNMEQRAIHATGDEATTRENIAVTSNTFIDCAGDSVMAADSGASNGMSVSNNIVRIGKLNKMVSGSYVFALFVTGEDNNIQNNLIDLAIIRASKYIRSNTGLASGTIARSPEGVATGGVGSIMQRVESGAAGYVFYVKQTGTSNTGWTSIA